jgi:tetratricopeptide (TPR) repeat protein
VRRGTRNANDEHIAEQINNLRGELMRYLRVISFLTLSIVLTPLHAQNNLHEQLAVAYALRGAGKDAEAAIDAKRLIDSGRLDVADDGRAWILVGICREDQGRYAEAQHAYETAISILNREPQAARDYASALDDLGHLYRAMGRWEEAVKLRKKAIGIFQEAGDHAGLSRAYFNLASLDLDLKHAGDCRKHIAMALDEIAHGAKVDDDDLAAGYSIRARLALGEHEITHAVEDYEHALALWQQVHGENHCTTGWGHVLLGAAYGEEGRLKEALEEAEKGLTILQRTVGTANPNYLHAEVVYADALDRAGQRAQAARLRAAANESLQELNRQQCAGCTLSVTSFR